MSNKRRRAAGEGSLIYLKTRKLWRGRLKVDGQEHYVHAKSQADARRKLDGLKQTLAAGLPVVSGTLTVGQFLDRWLAESIKPRRQPATYQRYVLDVQRHIIPTLGKVPLAKLTQQQVQALLTAKQQSGLSPRSVQMIQGTLRAALNRAMKWDLVSRNVATLVDAIQVRRPKVRPLTPQQAQQFIAASEGDRYTALYQVALALGLRRGEALALRWYEAEQPELGGVDLEHRVVHIRQGLQRIRGTGLMFVDVKTDRSRRDLPLPEMVIEALGVHRDRQTFERRLLGDRWQEHGLVFTSDIGTPLDPDNVTHRFQRFLKAAGLPHQRFHDLRHACASLMVANGEPLLVVQEQLGQASSR
jgi:integrase